MPQAVTVVRAQVSPSALGCHCGASHGCPSHSPRCHHGIEHGHLPASLGHHHGTSCAQGLHPVSLACNWGIGYGCPLHSPYHYHGTAQGCVCQPLGCHQGQAQPPWSSGWHRGTRHGHFPAPQAPAVSQSTDLFLAPHAVTPGQGRDVPLTPQARAQTSPWDAGLSPWEKAWATPGSPGCPPSPPVCPRAVSMQWDKRHPWAKDPAGFQACAVPRGGVNPCIIATATGRGTGTRDTGWSQNPLKTCPLLVCQKRVPLYRASHPVIAK